MPIGSGRRHPELLVILAGVCAALHVGKLSPALPVLRDALALTLLQAGFLLSLVQLAGMLFGLIAGMAADGIGHKRSMVAGLALLSIAAAAGGWAQDAASLLVSRALEGAGFLLVVLPAPGLIRRLVAPSRMTSALGYWGAYMPFGTALALLTGPSLLDAFGWRAWWWLLAGLSSAMALWVWRGVPSDQPAAGDSPGWKPFMANRLTSGKWASRLRLTVSSRGPWLVALSFAVYSGQWLAVIGFLPSMVAQQAPAGSAIAGILAFAALVNMGGNVAAGRLLQRGVPAHVLLYTGFCTMAAGAVVAFAAIDVPPGELQIGPASGLRYLGILLFSSVGGMIPGTLFSLAVVLAPNESSVSTTVGWMQQWSAAGQFAGPPLVAWVASAAGGWQWTWAITGCCSVAGLLLARQIARDLRR